MIVRPLGNHVYITRQPEHARHSAVIAAHLRPEFLGDVALHTDFLRATYHHDDGWAPHDADPPIGEDGWPLNFTGSDSDAHKDVWTNTIFGGLHRFSPAAAAIMARHARGILELDEEATAHQDELTTALAARAWPELDANAREAHVLRGASVLVLGDVLSLIALAGWADRFVIRLHNADGSEFPVEAWADGDWTVRVKPWPFLVPELRAVRADSVCIDKADAADARHILRHPRDHATVVAVDYLEG